MSKFEKKVGKDGIIRTERMPDVPEFKMPTEVTDPGFTPEGRILLCTIIPFSNESEVISGSGLVPGHNDEFVVESKTHSGIITATKKAKDKAPKAIVNAVGTEVRGYNVGDVIVYKPNPQSVFAIELNGETYIMMEQYNVLGKYRD